MKKTIFFMLVFCQSFVQAQQVHIVGSVFAGSEGGSGFYTGTEAVHWLNGRQIVLPKTGANANANAIAVSGSDVYILGKDDDDVVYWLNGRRIALPTTGYYAEASAIAVSGSNIYIVGTDGDDAVYWLNGRRFVLPKTGTRAMANAIAISGSNIYIVGTDGNDAVFWLNGNRTVLPKTGGQFYDYYAESEYSVVAASANAIFISGSDIYITGIDGSFIEGSGAMAFDAVYWLNGRRVALPNSYLINVSGIAISGQDIYIYGDVGVGFGSAAYWLNGTLMELSHTELPREPNGSTARAIAVLGQDVYIIGNAGFIDFEISGAAVYWLNGRQIILSLEAGANANAIVVTQ